MIGRLQCSLFLIALENMALHVQILQYNFNISGTIFFHTYAEFQEVKRKPQVQQLGKYSLVEYNLQDLQSTKKEKD